MRGSGFMDASIYSAMENAVEEYSEYQAHLEKAIELGMRIPVGE
jgi:transcriptional accessory protein Tex/SPT6